MPAAATVRRPVTAERIPIFRRDRSVAPRDVDLLGHVNNLVWVRYVVELAAAHADALGVGFEATRALGGIWIAPPRRPLSRQRVSGSDDSRSHLISAARRRSLRHARFESEAGALLVEAHTEWAYVDATTLRPRRVPAELRNRFTAIDIALER
jgi:acyl-CoA thioester hydrolase